MNAYKNHSQFISTSIMHKGLDAGESKEETENSYRMFTIKRLSDVQLAASCYHKNKSNTIQNLAIHNSIYLKEKPNIDPASNLTLLPSYHGPKERMLEHMGIGNRYQPSSVILKADEIRLMKTAIKETKAMEISKVSPRNKLGIFKRNLSKPSLFGTEVNNKQIKIEPSECLEDKDQTRYEDLDIYRRLGDDLSSSKLHKHYFYSKTYTKSVPRKDSFKDWSKNVKKAISSLHPALISQTEPKITPKFDKSQKLKSKLDSEAEKHYMQKIATVKKTRLSKRPSKITSKMVQQPLKVRINTEKLLKCPERDTRNPKNIA